MKRQAHDTGPRKSNQSAKAPAFRKIKGNGSSYGLKMLRRTRNDHMKALKEERILWITRK